MCPPPKGLMCPFPQQGNRDTALHLECCKLAMILEWGAGLGPCRVLGSPGCPTAARAEGVAWQGPGTSGWGLRLLSAGHQGGRPEPPPKGPPPCRGGCGWCPLSVGLLTGWGSRGRPGEASAPTWPPVLAGPGSLRSVCRISLALEQLSAPWGRAFRPALCCSAWLPSALRACLIPAGALTPGGMGQTLSRAVGRKKGSGRLSGEPGKSWTPWP